MRIGFYVKLAASNLSKNRRLYLPQMLTGAGLTAMFYIMLTLSKDERLHEVRGGMYLPSIMPLGVWVIGILSVILIFYTNSFLMKQRKQEFGLYNILGLEKRHVGRILFWETAISAILAVFSGLVLGILLYKLCALLICRIMAVPSVLGFYHILPDTLIPSAFFFLAFYGLAYLFNQIQIMRMKPVELLQSSHTGEKEPKVKRLYLVIGLVTLVAGYSIAVTTESPLQAINLFFVAVILVIVGTYCLFMAGSIALLKLLKGNKRFYYHPKHMISVSGLLYRMKQNAVGLASIAILATMVLVMVSTTVSMYAGIHDALKQLYPHQFYISAFYDTDTEENRPIALDELHAMAEKAAEANGLEIANTGRQKYSRQKYFTCVFQQEGDNFLTDQTEVSEMEIPDNLIECWFITAEEYEGWTGEHLDLSGNQVAVYAAPSNSGSMTDTVTIGEDTYDCAVTLGEYPISSSFDAFVDCYGFVVSDKTVFQHIYTIQKEAYGENASECVEQLVLDFTDEKMAETRYSSFEQSLLDEISRYAATQPGSTGGYGKEIDSKWDAEEYFYGANGTFLFLGLILTIVFLFATALIIYYKQISEGYEDRTRFQIMQKVGMSASEVKGTIRSQILLVFFLPLIVAAIHIIFAFPVLTKLLRILFQPNEMLFLWCVIGSFGVFAMIYVIIFVLTAKVYYRIVK